MLSMRAARWPGITAAAVALLLAGAVAPAAPDSQGAAIIARVKAYHGELKDMSAVMNVEHENDDALSDISHDFAEFVKFGFRKLKYYYKSPDKVRMESTATFFHFLKGISIRNGNRKDIYVPAFHIHKVVDVTGQENKKETALDFGVITGDIWDHYDVWFIRSEKDKDGDVYLLGLRPSNEPHGGTMIARLDAKTLKVLERARYNGDGVLQQREVFSKWVHALPHVWIPTLIEMYNNQGKLGGDLVYSKVEVNTGLDDKLFH
ncbi:MAG TPA: hypothetical protein VFJ58_26155 [Armatimonadota bacterium]|nr:hypothetical protein [Armatimonadota bacterium]